jgi:hypothetical protein
MSSASIAYLTAVHPLGISPDYYRISRRCKRSFGLAPPRQNRAVGTEGVIIF